LLLPLYRAQGVVGRSAGAKVTDCVLLGAQGTTLTVTATDHELSLRAEATADIAVPGVAMINCRALYDVVRGLPAGAGITLNCDENFRLQIRAGRSQCAGSRARKPRRRHGPAHC